MPEAYEVMYMVQEIKDKLHNFPVNTIKLRGHEFKKPKKQKAWEKLIESIPVPCTILDIKSRGKEICILTDKKSFRITLGQGSFLYFLKPEENIQLEMEPFFSDCFLSFEGPAGTFCFVDCHTIPHQIKLMLFDGIKPKWRPKCGPCVLTENKEFQEHFRNELKLKPDYFKSHSIAAIMYNESLCNGFGEYSVSEILHRLFLKFKICPWDSGAKVFADSLKLEEFLSMPLKLLKEQQLYYKDYNPASIGPKQLAQRTEFRIHFLQVYRKLKCNDTKVIPLAISILSDKKPELTLEAFVEDALKPKPPKAETTPKKASSSIEDPELEDKKKIPKLPKGKRKSVYTIAIPEDQIPSMISGKQKPLEDLLPGKNLEEARMKIQEEFIREFWFKFRGNFLTDELIGVGIHDMVSPNKENMEAMLNYGIPINFAEKGPEKTPKKRKSPSPLTSSPPKKMKTDGPVPVSPTSSTDGLVEVSALKTDGPVSPPVPVEKKKKKRSSKRINAHRKKIWAKGEDVQDVVLELTEGEAQLKRKFSSLKYRIIPDPPLKSNLLS